MKTLKIYSTKKPFSGYFTSPQTVCEVYKITNGTKNNSSWYTEVATEDYFNTRIELEKFGFTAHPAHSEELTDGVFTLFKEEVA